LESDNLATSTVLQNFIPGITLQLHDKEQFLNALLKGKLSFW
jgi:hypothetical protein